MSKDQDLRLLFVFSDPQLTEISDEEYHDWYDNEHLPPRLELDGFYSGVRYKAIDGQIPRFAAAYEHKAGVLQTDAYKRLFKERSAREAKIFDKIYLTRREYKLLSTHGNPGQKNAKVIVYAAVSPQKGAEEAFNKWYVEEHIPLVKKNPGWLGARRWEKTAGDGPNFLVIHEYEHSDWQTSPQFRAASEQAIEWMGKNLDSTAVKERRVLQRMYD